MSDIDLDDPKVVKIYTDGSCYPNPNGDGGWAFYCSFNGKTAIRYGYSDDATNNSMELEAIKHALLYVPTGYEYTIVILTDSQYAKNALTDWVYGWKMQGWKTAQGKPVRNIETIKHAHNLFLAHKEDRVIEIRWVKGHSGIPENELVDQRAGYARLNKKTNWKKQDNKNHHVTKK